MDYDIIKNVNNLMDEGMFQESINIIEKVNSDYRVSELSRLLAKCYLKLNNDKKYEEHILIAATDNPLAQYEIGNNMINGKIFLKNEQVGLGYLFRCASTHLMANYKIGLYYYDKNDIDNSKKYLSRFLIQSKNENIIGATKKLTECIEDAKSKLI